jgi:hypothetical protein
VIYTATVFTRIPEDYYTQNAEDDETAPNLLYPHTWQFNSITPDEKTYSSDRGCFISAMQDF